MSAARGAVSLLLALAACGGRATPPDVGPEPPRERPDVREEPPAGEEEEREGEGEARLPVPEEGRLPPIPRQVGALALRVQYPERGGRIAVRDSNFLFGTVGTGDAALEVDGRPVPVEPNGAFLAWLPVPSPVPGDTAVYRLVARRGTEADTLLHPVLVPPLPYVGPPGSAWVDTAALSPPVERWALPGERIPLRVRASPAAEVWVEVGRERLGLAPEERGEDAATYGATVTAEWLWRSASGAGPAALSRRGGADSLALTAVAALGPDTARLGRLLPLRLLDPSELPVATLRETPDSIHGPSGVVVGRPRPYGPYLWRFPPGVRAAVDGRRGDRLRLRLAPLLSAWVRVEDAEILPAGTPPPESSVGDLRVERAADRLVLRLGLQTPLPIQVDEPEERTLVLTLFGGYGDTDRVAYGPGDDLLESIRWEQLPGGLYRVTIRLRRSIWGYRASYEPGPARTYEGIGKATGPDAHGAASVLRLEVRRPPPVDPRRPLRGRRIAVDPGHPVGGAHGPTGLYEGDANLAVARRLAEMLREAGAIPILVRDDRLPVGLYERTARAEKAGAELFVSIHNDALPDGVRPFGREGTSTYYYHPHSRRLAEAVQEGMLAEMGLRDQGILWGDLAVTRTPWMPAVLTEGAFMMVPRHEAALQSPEFQERYARGVLHGLRNFLRQTAEEAEEARARDEG